VETAVEELGEAGVEAANRAARSAASAEDRSSGE
jgi:hypothetical protein